ncbi:hypothetical protein P7C70_g1181, partial [Phenoliferia sp. Uapishka_3]
MASQPAVTPFCDPLTAETGGFAELKVHSAFVTTTLPSLPYELKEIHGKQAASPYFTFAIAPKFGTHIRHLLITDPASARDATCAFLLVDSIPQLTLSASAARTILGSTLLADTSASQTHARTTTGNLSPHLTRLVFQRGVTCVTTLSLKGFSAADGYGLDGLVELVKATPSLRSLKWVSDSFAPTVATALSDISHKVTTLQYLELECTAVTPHSLDAAWSSQSWSRNIKSLSLRMNPTASLFDFISHFAPSLQSLTLNWACGQKATFILRALSQPSSKLEDVWVGLGLTNAGETRTLSSALDFHRKTLRRVRMVYSGFGAGSPRTVLARLKRHYPKVDIAEGREPDPFFCRRSVKAVEVLEDYIQMPVISQWADALEDTLATALDHLDDFRETGNLQGMEQMFGQLTDMRVLHLMTAPSLQ